MIAATMSRSPGPIPVSAMMARVFATCRALRLRAEAEGTTDVAALATLHAPSVLDLAELADVERRLGVALPDEVLATLATRIPLLEAASGLSLGAMADVAKRAADDLDDAWIALAEVAESPLDPNADDAPAYWLCVPREPAAGDALAVLWSIDEGVDGMGTSLPFAAMLEEQMDRAFGEWEIWSDVVDRVAAQPVDPFVQPALAGAAGEAPAAASGRRVRHKVFGEGTVVAETLDGKLEIEFDGVGRKTLLASFVTG
jgi:hypothetical protein